MWFPRNLFKINEQTIPLINSLPRLDPYPNWLIEECQLNEIQKAVCTLRYNNIKYSTIQALLGISSPNTISSIIRLTAGSRIWTGAQGGRISLISTVLIQRMINKINWKRRGLNCLKTFEAKQFILEELEDARRRGIERLHEWKAENLIAPFEEEFNSFDLTNSVFSTICSRCGIFVLSADNLELLRRRCCNHPAIDRYFNTITNLLIGIEPKYKFNADETGLAGKRTFKVLTDDRQIHVTVQDMNSSHISCMCCYSASGSKMDPFFIFPKRQSTMHELDDIDEIFVATSQNGWMTCHLWSIWCIGFISFISIKRERGQLDPKLPVFLFVDGHLSRLDPFGMRALSRFNIICIVFPAHSSHVLQPFDVGLGSPIKTVYLKELADPHVINQSNVEGLTPTEVIRRRRVIAFLNAWMNRDATQLYDSFHAAGLEPVSKENLAFKNLISDPLEDVDPSMRNAKQNPLSGTVATNNLDKLEPYKWRRIENNRFVVHDVNPADINAEMIRYEWNSGDAISGKIFNTLPPIYENGYNIFN